MAGGFSATMTPKLFLDIENIEKIEPKKKKKKERQMHSMPSIYDIKDKLMTRRPFSLGPPPK